MVWALLIFAILSEVTGTVALRFSDGFSKLVPSIIVAVGYLLSFVLLSQVLKRGFPVGVAYGIWSAVGVSLVALIGVTWLGESLTRVQVAGLALVIAGVVALQSGATSA
jgi:small multidrug resistance pump